MLMNIYLRSTEYILVPFTPKSVILNNLPAGAGCGVENSIPAVVAYNISKFGPPNATDVTCSAGNLISKIIFPVLKQNKLFF